MENGTRVVVMGPQEKKVGGSTCLMIPGTLSQLRKVYERVVGWERFWGLWKKGSKTGMGSRGGGVTGGSAHSIPLRAENSLRLKFIGGGVVLKRIPVRKMGTNREYKELSGSKGTCKEVATKNTLMVKL